MTIRLAWSTDIHLNFVEPDVLDQYIQQLNDTSADAVLVSGDIAEADSIVDWLTELDARVYCPIFFVLGNHDYYRGSIAQVRQAVRQLCAEREKLVYLSESPLVELSPQLALVGHDGWADGRIGDYERSMISMSDDYLIEDLKGLSKRDRWTVLKSLGDEAASWARQHLPRAIERYSEVFFVTHVPPLRAACWYNGRISDDEWAPHFTCKAMGDVLLECARQYTKCDLTVLCGHTHGAGECQVLPQMRVLTGGAEYGFPAVNQVFRLDE